MACPECGGKVSGKAYACPHCGYNRMGARRSGCLLGTVKGLIKLVVIGFLILLIATIFSSMRSPRKEPAGGAPSPAISTGPAPAPAPEPPAPEPGLLPLGVAVGDRVEVDARMVCADLGVFRRRPKDGGRPPGAENGKDVFGVSVSNAGEVTALEPGAVQVRMAEGNWKGRLGWVRPEEVRHPPTKEESDADVIRGLTLLQRREIYKAIHRAGMEASAAANEAYPLIGSPSDGEERSGKFEAREKLYKATKLKDQRAVMKEYRIDRAQLDAIDKEGAEERWPLGAE